jgi:hypothetical protein
MCIFSCQRRNLHILYIEYVSHPETGTRGVAREKGGTLIRNPFISAEKSLFQGTMTNFTSGDDQKEVRNLALSQTRWFRSSSFISLTSPARR